MKNLKMRSALPIDWDSGSRACQTSTNATGSRVPRMDCSSVSSLVSRPRPLPLLCTPRVEIESSGVHCYGCGSLSSAFLISVEPLPRHSQQLQAPSSPHSRQSNAYRASNGDEDVGMAGREGYECSRLAGAERGGSLHRLRDDDAARRPVECRLSKDHACISDGCLPQIRCALIFGPAYAPAALHLARLRRALRSQGSLFPPHSLPSMPMALSASLQIQRISRTVSVDFYVTLLHHNNCVLSQSLRQPLQIVTW